MKYVTHMRKKSRENECRKGKLKGGQFKENIFRYL